MEATLTYNYPIWFIALCILLGFIYAFVLYFRSSTFKEADEKTRKGLKWLSVLRFLAVSFLAFLLMAPLLKTKSINYEQPIIVYAQDNSASIGNYFTDTGKNKFKNRINALVKKLGEKYEVHSYQFGDKVKDSLSFEFDEKITDINAAMTEIYDRYSNQNIGAVILSSDGIFNSGANPIYSNKKLPVPIYAIALGDTTIKKDLKIEKVYYNKIAYLNDKFTIKIDVLANNCANKNTAIQIYKLNPNGQKTNVLRKPLKIDNKDFIQTVDVVLDANRVGVNQYTVSINEIDGEETLDNNYQDLFIEVLDGRQKILILAESPHPDIATLKNVINSNKNYEVEVAYIKKFKKQINEFDLLILHGLPSKNNLANSIFNQIETQNKPVWYIITGQTAIANLNDKQNLLKIDGSNGQINNSNAALFGNFNLFTLNEKVSQSLRNLPPLNTPFGNYKSGAVASTLFNQKIGTVETDYPLFVFEQSGTVKRAVLAGEGLWRWKLYDYQSDQEQETIKELIGKTVQYLSVKNDKRQFRVNSQKNIYYENEEINFDAELYNDSYELINDANVNMIIKDENNKEFPFVFDKTQNAYNINAGVFPVGKYSFTANCTFGQKKYDANGKFNVIPLQIEQINSTANHEMLYNITEQTGGKVYYPNEINKLSNFIFNKTDIKPVSFSSYDTKEIINLRWIFFILLFLLSLEWFIRKYNGAY